MFANCTNGLNSLGISKRNDKFKEITKVDFCLDCSVVTNDITNNKRIFTL